MRHEVLYLTDIVDAADQIVEFLAETESAVVHKLSIIGVAAARGCSRGPLGRIGQRTYSPMSGAGANARASTARTAP